MTNEWNWSDIVDPRRVERALADEKSRAEQRKRDLPANDQYVAHMRGDPVAA